MLTLESYFASIAFIRNHLRTFNHVECTASGKIRAGCSECFDIKLSPFNAKNNNCTCYVH